MWEKLYYLLNFKVYFNEIEKSKLKFRVRERERERNIFIEIEIVYKFDKWKKYKNSYKKEERTQRDRRIPHQRSYFQTQPSLLIRSPLCDTQPYTYIIYHIIPEKDLSSCINLYLSECLKS